jgi:hypothetical protein
MKRTLKRLLVKCALGRRLPVSLAKPAEAVCNDIKTLRLVVGDGLEGKTCCNINFDDLCPRYGVPNGLDFGGDPQKGISLEFKKLLDDYPHIAVTHFVVPAYDCGRTTGRSTRKAICTDISVGNQDWLAYYKGLSSHYSVEYAQHGYRHRQHENFLFARQAEFAYKTGSESREAISRGLEILGRSGLDVCGFRQPGWDISGDFSICSALLDLGFTYIAGSSLDGGFNSQVQRVSNYFPAFIKGIINFPQNISLAWSLGEMKREIDKIVELGGIISIKGHFVNGGIPNSFTSKNIHKLRATLDYLGTRYSGRIVYVTLKQAAELVGQETRLSD